MKRFYSFLLLLAATVLTATVRAQVINGDLNHNQGLDVEDVTLLIDGYLTGETEVYTPRIDFYQEDNSLVVGTWYRSKTDFLTLNADGTTNYGNGYTYRFLPSQGCILFLNAARTPVTYIKVIYFNSNSLGKYMATKFPGKDDLSIYYTEPPIQLVESITLSKTSLYLQLDSDPVRLTATVEPSDADNTSVEWMSSNEEVATVSSRGTVEAVGEGIAVIICTAADGSGVKATCEVTVVAAPEQEYVDLGLSVKWATTNIGASTPEEYGDYFAWGETEPKDNYDWSTYKWCNGSYSTMTKYCTNSGYGTVDNKSVLDPEDDAAHVNRGGTWRMPTTRELGELKTKCTWKWTTKNSVEGYKVTGPNGNSIFLPAAGCRYDSSLSGAGSYGSYWSSSLQSSYPPGGGSLYFYSSNFYDTNGDRFYGRSVRAVCP